MAKHIFFIFITSGNTLLLLTYYALCMVVVRTFSDTFTGSDEVVAYAWNSIENLDRIIYKKYRIKGYYIETMRKIMKLTTMVKTIHL